MKPASLTVPARPEFVSVASAFVVQTARELGADRVLTPLFEVAVGEALANAVKHGSRGLEHATVTCEVEGCDGALSIRILDEGEGFDFSPREVPIDADNIDIASLPESGYGIPIIQTVFKEIRTRRTDGRFCLELRVGPDPAVSCP